MQYGRCYVQKLNDKEKQAEKTGRGNSVTYNAALNSLQKYINRDTLDIAEITPKFIHGWIDWILTHRTSSNRQTGERAASLYPSNIRALHNRAKEEFNNEDEGIIRIPLSPFSKVKLPAMPKVRKRALPPEKIKQIFNLPYREKPQHGVTDRFNLAKDMFILSFCLLGINSIDLYFCDELKGGRLIYQRIKTHNRRSDKAEMSIKTEPEIAGIMEKYRDATGVRVFRFHAMYSTPQNFNTAINNGLKQIGKIICEDDLEYYAARHSWATIARNRCDVSKYDIHEFLNHAPDSDMKVTDIYIDKDFSVQDKTNRKVLDYIVNY
jgi:integrase